MIEPTDSMEAVPRTPTDLGELVREINELSDKLNVTQVLQMYNATISTIGAAKDAKYFLLQLDPDEGKITVRRFKAKESGEANRQYTKLESEVPEGSGLQVVLVSVENITALKRAYPNYFLDTNTFAELVNRVLTGSLPEPIPHQTIADAA